mmetsp:Transcript_30541/g.88797  ORF Transcript_30541/g.88797 Transcript_30541/m.88797 type:complete len:702 (+) Transcript_30541:41-2146(+)
MKLKEGSKRQPLGRKYKIQKKAREHTRKMRKIAKTAPVKKSKRKESGIPNNWPFKAEWLRHIQQQRERDAQEKKERREALRQQQIALKEQEKSASKKGSRAAAGAGGAAADEEDEWEDVPDDDDDDVIDEEMDDEPAPKRKKTSREQTGAAGKKSALPPFADPSGAAFNVTKGVTYEMLAADAAQRQGLFGPAGAGPQPEAQTKTADYRGESSRKSWYKDLQKVVNESDIVVEVLDARDPNSCRCRELERSIVAQSKKLVVVLNKIDLIPKSALEAWLKYLRREYPTIAFKAALGGDKVRHAKTSAQQASDALLKSGSAVVGADALMQLVKNYARTGSSNVAKSKQSMSVGIIGYPNVGKSSVINTLKRKKVCKAAPVPGETKIWQYVSLTNRIYLIDCPGVVPGDSYRTDGTQDTLTVEADKVLKGIVRAEKLSAPAEYVNEVLSRVKKEYLLKKYNLPADTTWTDDEDFLTILAKKCGRLLKGGDPDIQTAARTVIYDFQRGRIPYFVPPPMLNDPSHKHQTATAASGATSDSTVAVVAAEPSAVTESSQEGDEGDKETPPVKVKQSFKALKCSMDFDSSDLGTRGGAPDEQQEDDADGALDADDQDQDDGSDADDARAESKRQRLLAALKRKRQLSSPPPRKRAKEGGATMDKGKGGRVDQPGSSGAPSVPIAGPLSRVKAPKGEDVDWGMLYKEFES